MHLKTLCFICTLGLGFSPFITHAQIKGNADSSVREPFRRPSKLPQAKLVQEGSTVSLYELPQDRMICLVPNRKVENQLNAWSKNDSCKIHNNILNASPVYKIIPDTVLAVRRTMSFNKNQ